MSGAPTPSLELISSLYEAVDTPSRWPSVVTAMTEWVGGSLGGLQFRRPHPPFDSTLVAPGLEASLMNLYAERLYQSDPHLVHLVALPVGRTLLSREVLGDNELQKTEFFEEFCRPQGLQDLQGVVLLSDEQLAVTFAIYSSTRQRFDQDSCRRLTALIPHLTRAVRLARRLAVADEERQELRLQCPPPPSLRLDAAWCVLRGDLSFHAWMERSGVMCVREGRLQVRDPALRDALGGGVQRALLGQATELTVGTGGQGSRLLVAPAPPLYPFRAGHHVVLLLEDTPPDATLLAQLSPSLQPVAQLMAQGFSDKDIAARLPLSLATVRTYVRRIMAQLGLRSRRDLMLAMARRGA